MDIEEILQKFAENYGKTLSVDFEHYMNYPVVDFTNARLIVAGIKTITEIINENKEVTK